MLVSPERKVRRTSPPTITAMPAEERMRGSYRSDNFPDSEATRAMVAGWVTRTIPASLGAMPRTTCR